MPPTDADKIAKYLHALESPETLEAVDEMDIQSGRSEVHSSHIIVEIQESWKTAETTRVDPAYFNTVQTNLRVHMRLILVSWLIELGVKFELHDESVWQAIQLVDIYCSKKSVHRNEYQAVGAACLWIATKNHEIYPPLAKDMAWISKSTFSKQQLKETENAILETLEYEISGPTAITFLKRYAHVAVNGMNDQKYIKRLTYLSRYAMERGMLRPELIGILASKLAATSLYMGLSSMGMPWTQTLVRVTGYQMNDIRDDTLNIIRATVTMFNDKRHKTVIRKYMSEKRGAVSTLRPRQKNS